MGREGGKERAGDRGRERKSQKDWRSEVMGGGQLSLTKGLPRVDVNDEAGDWVPTQDLVVSWAKETRAADQVHTHSKRPPHP
jgi:hypothetical protein